MKKLTIAAAILLAGAAYIDPWTGIGSINGKPFYMDRSAGIGSFDGHSFYIDPSTGIGGFDDSSSEGDE